MKNHDTPRFNHFQRWLRGRSIALVAALLLPALVPIGSIEFAAAADRYWDATAGAGNGVGGDGTWQAQSGIFPTWSTTSVGDAVLVNAATTDVGIFQGTAGTVVISGTPFTLASWTFNTTNYTIRTNNTVTRVLNGPWSLAANVNLNMGVTTTTTDVNMNIVGSISGGSGSKLTIRGGQDPSAAMRVNLSAAGSTISVPIEIIEVGDGMAGVAAINTGAVISNTITNNSTGATMLGATNAFDLTVNGVISGTAAVRFEGNLFAGGTVNLGAQNNYTGNSVMNISNVKLGVSNALSTSSALQFVFGNLDMNGKNQTVTSLASLTAGTQSISNASGTLSTFTIQGSATTTYSGTIGAPSANNIALALSSTNTGILALSGANTYTGETTISGGELRINGAASLPGGIDTAVAAGESALTLNGGVLGLNASNFTRALGTGAGQVQFTADGGFAAYSADRLVNLGGATATVAWGSGNFVPTASKLIFGTADATHALTFQNPIDFNAGTRTVQVNDGFAAVEANLSGTLSNGALTKTGDGTMVLSGTNTFTGVTTLSAGVLSVSIIGNGGVSGNLGAASNAAANLVFDDGTLQYTGATASTDRNFTINVDKTATFDITTNNLTVGGVSTATNGGLTKIGVGTLTLSGANIYSGGTTIAGGTLSLGSAGAIGTTGSILFNGGTLQYTASNTADYSSRFNSASADYRIDTNGQNVTFASPLTGAASLTKIGGGTIYLTADNTYTGGTTVGNQGVYLGNGGTTGSITGNVTISSGGTLGFYRSNALTFANTITGDGAVLKAGSGATTLTGNNTYSGGTHLVEGTLSLGSSGAIGATGPIYFLGGTLQHSASNTTDYSSRLEAYADCRIDTNGQNVTFASPLAAFAGLTKLGDGSLVLTSANTYSGDTNVDSGRLLVNNTSGSGTGAGNVTVNSGGTLGGTGLISGVVTVNSGGHVSPGASIESLDVGSLVLSTGSILDFGLGAPSSPGVNSDLINVTADGGLALNGGSIVLTNAGGLAAGTYTLIDYVGTLGGAVANFGEPIGPAGFSFALLNNLSNTSIDLTVSLLGDYNNNGAVDAADYVLWRKGGPLVNEVDAPGTVNGADYTAWRARFGNPGSGAGANANAGVPEPSTVVLLMFAAAGLYLRPRRAA